MCLELCSRFIRDLSDSGLGAIKGCLVASQELLLQPIRHHNFSEGAHQAPFEPSLE